jgi:hypothetical protein
MSDVKPSVPTAAASSLSPPTNPTTIHGHGPVPLERKDSVPRGILVRDGSRRRLDRGHSYGHLPRPTAAPLTKGDSATGDRLLHRADSRRTLAHSSNRPPSAGHRHAAGGSGGHGSGTQPTGSGMTSPTGALSGTPVGPVHRQDSRRTLMRRRSDHALHGGTLAAVSEPLSPTLPAGSAANEAGSGTDGEGGTSAGATSHQIQSRPQSVVVTRAPLRRHHSRSQSIRNKRQSASGPGLRPRDSSGTSSDSDGGPVNISRPPSAPRSRLKAYGGSRDDGDGTTATGHARPSSAGGTATGGGGSGEHKHSSAAGGGRVKQLTANVGGGGSSSRGSRGSSGSSGSDDDNDREDATGNNS